MTTTGGREKMVGVTSITGAQESARRGVPYPRERHPGKTTMRRATMTTGLRGTNRDDQQQHAAASLVVDHPLGTTKSQSLKSQDGDPHTDTRTSGREVEVEVKFHCMEILF